VQGSRIPWGKSRHFYSREEFEFCPDYVCFELALLEQDILDGMPFPWTSRTTNTSLYGPMMHFYYLSSSAKAPPPIFLLQG